MDDNLSDIITDITVAESQKIFFTRYDYDKGLLKTYLRNCKRTNRIFEIYKKGHCTKVIIPELIDTSIIDYKKIVGDFVLIKKSNGPLCTKDGNIVYKSIYLNRSDSGECIIDVLYKCDCGHVIDSITNHKAVPKYVDFTCSKCKRVYRMLCRKKK